MFGIGETELALILLFAFLLFGPDKLPGMGRTIGRMLRQFRDASDSFTEVMQTNIMDPAAEELKKSPKQRKAEEAADTDSDIEGAGERRETFAERKARLKAEREAAAASAGATATATATVATGVDAADSDADSDADADADSVVDLRAVADADSDDDLEPAPQPAEDASARLASLYSTAGRHSTRAQAKIAAGPAKDGAEEKAEAPAGPAKAADSTRDSGEGDGKAEA